MTAKGSSLVIRRYDGFGGNYISSQYLGGAYDVGKPDMLDNTLSTVYAAKSRFFTGKLLMGMTKGNPIGSKEIETETVRWMLQGAEVRNAVQLINLESGNTAPGLNGTSFRIKLDLNYYAKPDVLMPRDPEFPCEILDGPFSDGDGFVYVVRLQGDDPTRYLPSDNLEVGAEWSKAWTSVQSEGNDVFGTQQYAAPFMLESQVGAFAQKLTVTDKALRVEGRLGFDFIFTDPNTGKQQVIKRFLPYAESKMWNELYQSMEAQAWYGVKQTKPAADGMWIKTSPGIREQLKDGNTEYINSAPSVTRLKDYFMDVFFAREDENNRDVTGMTGSLGAVSFHDALAAVASSFLTMDTHYIRRTSSDYTTEALEFGSMFTSYVGPLGIKIKMAINPLYDSARYCKIYHPVYTEYPIDSARLTFMDFGTTGGSQNILALKVKDTYRHATLMGTVGPMGPVKGQNVAMLKAQYDISAEGTFGIVMLDPTKGGELIYTDQATL